MPSRMPSKCMGREKAETPKILGLHVSLMAASHIKAGRLWASGNPTLLQRSMPIFRAIQKIMGCRQYRGVIVVCDAANGRLLALIDSIEITIMRTGAATGSRCKISCQERFKSPWTIVGCGNQGRISLKSSSCRQTTGKKVFAYDTDQKSGLLDFAREFSREPGIAILPVNSLPQALKTK